MTIKTQRLLARAKKIAKKGEIEEARKLYTSILKDSPHNQEAKNELLALQQSKDQLKPPKEEIQSVHIIQDLKQYSYLYRWATIQPKQACRYHSWF